MISLLLKLKSTFSTCLEPLPVKTSHKMADDALPHTVHFDVPDGETGSDVTGSRRASCDRSYSEERSWRSYEQPPLSRQNSEKSPLLLSSRDMSVGISKLIFFFILLHTRSDEREVSEVWSIPAAILSSCQNMKTIVLKLHMGAVG